MKSFHIITFGCQMNEHDSERMAGMLEAQGFVAAADVGHADMVILNTCSIREKAEQKFYSEMGRLALRKEEGGRKVAIAVAGCIAQQEGARILSRVPSVDLVLGPSDIAKLPALLTRKEDAVHRAVDISGDPDYHRRSIPAKRSDRVKAWVSIMYGCDNFCAYCVVPHLRGRERSRPVENIVREVQDLAGRGYREVTLLGQNVNSYGKGLVPAVTFAGLLRRIHEIDGIERIRFVTSHPRDLSDDLMALFRDLPKMCEALHLPVQSGSNAVLSLMKRGYTVEEYLAKVRVLRSAAPGIVLTTDIIVGFPGESREDHEMTLRLLKEAEFDGIFAFKYSKRPNTAALKMDGHVPEEEKESRLAELFSVQQPITARSYHRNIGTVQEVLIDGKSKRGGTLTGRTRGNRVVNMAGPADSIGKVVLARITSAGTNSLGGDLCG